MTNETENPDSNLAGDESLSQLMRLAGERPEVPLSVESRVYHQVKQDWQAATAKPNSDKVYEEVRKSWQRSSQRNGLLRWLVPAGVAVAAVMVLFSMISVNQSPPQAMQISASVSRVVGSGSFARQYVQGMPVHAGAEVSTGPGEGVSLLLARGESLRIDENTRIRVDEADHFTLMEGRIYIDTGEFVYRDGGVKIETSLGVVTDVGTQFSVAAIKDSLDVAVREGRVDVAHKGGMSAARMGERLSLTRGEGVSIGELNTHDDYWNWVVDLTPAFDITNKTLLDFLKWAARETGRELEFESNVSRMSAMRTDVHGSIDGMTPNEALVAILATTTVRYRVEDDRIVIED